MKGTELKRWIREFGFTQDGFAQHIDVAPETVSRWVKGHRDIPTIVVRYCEEATELQDLRDKIHDLIT